MMVLLFIFRRDLRVHDNTGLRWALSRDKVVPCFILDPRQAGEQPYRSRNALQFMEESLRDLDEQLRRLGSRLHVFEGEAERVVAGLLERVDGVVVNRDYTPFSRSRDEALRQLCEAKTFHADSDLLLTDPDAVRTGAGKPYTVFTPFYRATSRTDIAHPKETKGTFATIPGSITLPRLATPNPDIAVHGGRREGLAILKHLGTFADYEERQNELARHTTMLSAHNKFGTLSIREVYHAMRSSLGPFHALIRQLYWRDFFTHIAYHFPHVFGGNFHKKYDRVAWEGEGDAFRAWCEGKTGFPVVDAGMRELVATGYMQNRARMVVASFLTKDLHVDWRLGERFFAQHLVDYDPAVNNGSWQWAASTGCDAQPYFRIFNPWRQQQRFDPECRYIKRWLPELAELSPSQIHGWAGEPRGAAYPAPIVDHHVEKEEALRRFR